MEELVKIPSHPLSFHISQAKLATETKVCKTTTYLEVQLCRYLPRRGEVLGLPLTLTLLIPPFGFQSRINVTPLLQTTQVYYKKMRRIKRGIYLPELSLALEFYTSGGYNSLHSTTVEVGGVVPLEICRTI